MAFWSSVCRWELCSAEGLTLETSDFNIRYGLFYVYLCQLLVDNHLIVFLDRRRCTTVCLETKNFPLKYIRTYLISRNGKFCLRKHSKRVSIFTLLTANLIVSYKKNGFNYSIPESTKQIIFRTILLPCLRDHVCSEYISVNFATLYKKYF